MKDVFYLIFFLVAVDYGGIPKIKFNYFVLGCVNCPDISIKTIFSVQCKTNTNYPRYVSILMRPTDCYEPLHCDGEGHVGRGT